MQNVNSALFFIALIIQERGIIDAIWLDIMRWVFVQISKILKKNYRIMTMNSYISYFAIFCSSMRKDGR